MLAVIMIYFLVRANSIFCSISLIPFSITEMLDSMLYSESVNKDRKITKQKMITNMADSMSLKRKITAVKWRIFKFLLLKSILKQSREILETSMVYLQQSESNDTQISAGMRHHYNHTCIFKAIDIGLH